MANTTLSGITVNARLIRAIRKYPSISFSQLMILFSDLKLKEGAVSAQLNKLSKLGLIRRIKGELVYSYFPIED
jgi:DNA-binding MarR family transcriptional regulator